MHEFVPPTALHFWIFAGLVLGGTVAIVYSETHKTASYDLVSIFDGLVSVLIISAGYTIILVEGWNMFAEAWIEKRRKRIREEGREEGKKELAEHIQEAMDKGTFTKDTLRSLLLKQE